MFDRVKLSYIIGGATLFFLIIIGTVLAQSITDYVVPREVEAWPQGGPITPQAPPVGPRFVELEELEQQAGFKTLQPTFVPANCTLTEQFYKPLGREAMFIYNCGREMFFDIAQKKAEQIDRPRIGPNSSKQVEINGQPAIYVDGGWLIGPGEKEGTWIPGYNQQLFMTQDELVVRVIAAGMDKETVMKIGASLE